jgi:hypothetical protein
MIASHTKPSVWSNLKIVSSDSRRTAFQAVGPSENRFHESLDSEAHVPTNETRFAGEPAHPNFLKYPASVRHRSARQRP